MFAKFGNREGRYGKRHAPGVMNKTEAAYAECLEALRLSDKTVVAWKFESIKFKLAENKCWYSPDFMVLYSDAVMEFVDVKGSGPINEASIVRIKCAAEQFPYFRFVMEQRMPAKHGGGWKRTEY